MRPLSYIVTLLPNLSSDLSIGSKKIQIVRALKSLENDDDPSVAAAVKEALQQMKVGVDPEFSGNLADAAKKLVQQGADPFKEDALQKAAAVEDDSIYPTLLVLAHPKDRKLNKSDVDACVADTTPKENLEKLYVIAFINAIKAGENVEEFAELFDTGILKSKSAYKSYCLLKHAIDLKHTGAIELLCQKGVVLAYDESGFEDCNTPFFKYSYHLTPDYYKNYFGYADRKAKDLIPLLLKHSPLFYLRESSKIEDLSADLRGRIDKEITARERASLIFVWQRSETLGQIPSEVFTKGALGGEDKDKKIAYLSPAASSGKEEAEA